MELKFAKYQGAGNDFVVIDGRQYGGLGAFLSTDIVRGICCRRTGVGADGLMVLGDVDGVMDGEWDFSMTYYNSDGLEGTMCGNGGRCVVRFADDLGIGGVEKRFVAVDGGHFALVSGDLIELSMNDVVRVNGVEEGWMLDTGSPHLVVEGVWDEGVARRLRQKYNANVNFVEKVGENYAFIKTYERGVEAMTWACGTGAVAVAVVLAHLENIRGAEMRGEFCGEWEIESKGGVLGVKFEVGREVGRYENVWLSGPAVRVFEGSYTILI